MGATRYWENDVIKPWRAALAAAFLFLAAGPAMAFPDRPIRLVVGFPPGGSADVVARAIQPLVEKRLGQPLIIENKAGAGGVIATDATAKAAPDGYTLLLTTPNHTINAAINPKLPYDTEKDLAAVSIVADVPELLVYVPNIPVV